MPHPDYPEHAKLANVQPQSQAIGEFLEWLTSETGHVIAKYGDDERLRPSYESINGLLAQFFQIDLTVLETEKRAMLDHQRALNDLADAQAQPKG